MKIELDGTPCRHCGGTKWYQHDDGPTNHGRSCAACLLRTNKAWVVQHPSHELVRLAKRRAKAKGLSFDLRPEDIVIPELCPVLGIPLIRGGKARDNWPSLDRMVPALGYTRDNVRVISYRANRIKNDASADELARIHTYVTAGSIEQR